MVGAINKLYGKTWDLNGATYVDGVFTFPANVFAMATCSMPNPIPNHIYYGGVEQKAPSGSSFPDRRFEWWKGDGAGELMVFAYMDGTNDQWVRQSAVYQAEADTSGSWVMRNFTVNGTAEAYRRNPIIIDLTEVFGAGNEPTAAWVDANMIPSANGDTIFFDIPSALSEISDKRRMMMAGGRKISPVLEENDWKTISEVAKKGEGQNYWSVGDTKSVIVNGTFGNVTISNAKYYVYILGFNHNESIEGKGIHFGCFKTAATNGKDITFDGFTMTYDGMSTGGWASCQMRNTYLASFLTCLPVELQKVISSCTKYSNNKDGINDILQTYITATSDKIFLPSEFEYCGIRTYANSYEQNYQKQYAYYAMGNSKLKYKHNATTTVRQYWTRSVQVGTTTNFCMIYTNGKISATSSNSALGLSPAFKV